MGAWFAPQLVHKAGARLTFAAEWGSLGLGRIVDPGAGRQEKPGPAGP